LAAAILFFLWKPLSMSDFEVERKARDLGMVYQHELVVFKEEPEENKPQEAEKVLGHNGHDGREDL